MDLINFNIPQQAIINNGKGKRVEKTTILNNVLLKNTEKKILDDINNIYIKAIFNPDSINIQTYQDDIHNYDEILFIIIESKSDNYFNKIAELLQTIIPYQVILLVYHNDNIQLSLTHKTINKIDQNNNVCEYFININTKNEHILYNILDFKNAPYTNTFILYNYLVNNACKYILEQALEITINKTNNLYNIYIEIIPKLKYIDDLKKEIKKEVMFEKKVEINNKINTIKKEITYILKNNIH